MNCCSKKSLKPQETETETEAKSNKNDEIEVEIGSINNKIYFYLVRHGETDYNKQGKIQGHMEIPLNKNGFNQAKSLGQCITKYVKDINAKIRNAMKH